MNCHHNVAQLRRLREQFPDTLVVLGIHSAKFPAEKELANIREAVQRHGIDHPVANDAHFDVWQQYAVKAWPTVMLIDARGRIIETYSGEIDADALSPRIHELIEQAENEGRLDRTPLATQLEREAAPERVLRYPSKLYAPGDGRLFVADTGHHRVLELRLEGVGAARVNGTAPGSGVGGVGSEMGAGEGSGSSSASGAGEGTQAGDAHADPSAAASALSSAPTATIVRVFGSGEPGFVDGAADEARFHDPHGMALATRAGGAGETLYVADTENHAIRAIDLADGTVRTVAGTGEKGGYGRPGAPLETALRSPWDVWADGEALLIAMAGSHQIWALVGERELGVFAGTGREALVDGPRAEASFNQPSDLAMVMGHLIVADSEASAIRAIRLDKDPRVFTLVGLGLFDFGDIDGQGAAVRLQHPTGLAAVGDEIYIADSYNHKLKILNPGSGVVRTQAGTGTAGATDGAALAATFFEPEGLAWDDLRALLYVADTNNHAIRVVDPASGTVETLRIEAGRE